MPQLTVGVSQMWIKTRRFAQFSNRFVCFLLTQKETPQSVTGGSVVRMEAQRDPVLRFGLLQPPRPCRRDVPG